ncbi:MAG: RNA polymerase sigma-70 factor [Bacteroidota bacterium]
MDEYRKFSDQELTSLLTGGDQKAYTEIYNRYKKLLYTFALKRLDDEQEAEDILHELFLSLWTRREQFGAETLLAPYLYNGVRYQIINILSRKKLNLRYLDSFNQYLKEELTTEETDHLVRHNELAELIENEIAALPLKMREVFELSRKSGYSRKEIAQELGLSEETVKSHMYHALKILKVKLGTMSILLFL